MIADLTVCCLKPAEIQYEEAPNPCNETRHSPTPAALLISVQASGKANCADWLQPKNSQFTVAASMAVKSMSRLQVHTHVQANSTMHRLSADALRIQIQHTVSWQQQRCCMAHNSRQREATQFSDMPETAGTEIRFNYLCWVQTGRFEVSISVPAYCDTQ